jgi:hypothetical protein
MAQAQQSAREIVLFIPELLECILHWLPLKDLFRLQSVSEHWRNVIRASPQLQMAMFIVPTGPVQELNIRHSLPKRCSLRKAGDLPVLQNNGFDIVVAPFLKHIRQPDHSVPCPSHRKRSSYCLQWNAGRGSESLLPWTDRQIFVTQPPIDALVVDVLNYHGCKAWQRPQAIKSKQGIKISHVAKACLKMLEMDVNDPRRELHFRLPMEFMLFFAVKDTESR